MTNATNQRTCDNMVEGALKDLQETHAKLVRAKSRYERLSEHLSEYRRFVISWTDAELRLDSNRQFHTLQYDNRPKNTYFAQDPVVKILTGIVREERDAAMGTQNYYRNYKRAYRVNELLENLDGRKMTEDVYKSILDGMHPVVTEKKDEDVTLGVQ